MIQTAKFLDETTEILAKANRRTMDQIAAKVYFYLALAFERQGRLQELQPCVPPPSSGAWAELTGSVDYSPSARPPHSATTRLSR